MIASMHLYTIKPQDRLLYQTAPGHWAKEEMCAVLLSEQGSPVIKSCDCEKNMLAQNSRSAALYTYIYNSNLKNNTFYNTINRQMRLGWHLVHQFRMLLTYDAKPQCTANFRTEVHQQLGVETVDEDTMASPGQVCSVVREAYLIDEFAFECFSDGLKDRAEFLLCKVCLPKHPCTRVIIVIRCVAQSEVAMVALIGRVPSHDEKINLQNDSVICIPALRWRKDGVLKRNITHPHLYTYTQGLYSQLCIPERSLGGHMIYSYIYIYIFIMYTKNTYIWATLPLETLLFQTDTPVYIYRETCIYMYIYIHRALYICTRMCTSVCL